MIDDGQFLERLTQSFTPINGRHKPPLGARLFEHRRGDVPKDLLVNESTQRKKTPPPGQLSLKGHLRLRFLDQQKCFLRILEYLFTLMIPLQDLES